MVKSLRKIFAIKKSRTLVSKLFVLLQQYKEAYPNFFVTYSISCVENRWVITFQIRGAIPWRDTELVFRSEENESLSLFAGKTVDTLRKRLLLLRKRLRR
jgi:hypothetical protein